MQLIYQAVLDKSYLTKISIFSFRQTNIECTVLINIQDLEIVFPTTERENATFSLSDLCKQYVSTKFQEWILYYSVLY